jgi:hypothetical protein
LWSAKAAESARVKSWEIIADNLSKAGWSWGCVSAADCEGRTIWIADAHREGGEWFVVPAEENLSIAKALPKERQPRHGAIALRLPTGYSA